MGCYHWIYYRSVDIFDRRAVRINVLNGQWLRRYVFLLFRIILLLRFRCVDLRERLRFDVGMGI